MSERDLVYCDAGFFDKNGGIAILGILYKKELTRIKARAKNATIAELLAVVMAHKLYPGRIIVNDCLSVVRVFNMHHVETMRRWIGSDSLARALVGQEDLRAVVWQKRRTSDETCMVDSLTRKNLTRNYKWRLGQLNYDLKEINF